MEDGKETQTVIIPPLDIPVVASQEEGCASPTADDACIGDSSDCGLARSSRSRSLRWKLSVGTSQTKATSNGREPHASRSPQGRTSFTNRHHVVDWPSMHRRQSSHSGSRASLTNRPRPSSGGRSSFSNRSFSRASSLAGDSPRSKDGRPRSARERTSSNGQKARLASMAGVMMSSEAVLRQLEEALEMARMTKLNSRRTYSSSSSSSRSDTNTEAGANITAAATAKAGTARATGDTTGASGKVGAKAARATGETAGAKAGAGAGDAQVTDDTAQASREVGAGAAQATGGDTTGAKGDACSEDHEDAHADPMEYQSAKVCLGPLKGSEAVSPRQSDGGLLGPWAGTPARIPSYRGHTSARHGAGSASHQKWPRSARRGAHGDAVSYRSSGHHVSFYGNRALAAHDDLVVINTSSPSFRNHLGRSPSRPQGAAALQEGRLGPLSCEGSLEGTLHVQRISRPATAATGGERPGLSPSTPTSTSTKPMPLTDNGSSTAAHLPTTLSTCSVSDIGADNSLTSPRPTTLGGVKLPAGRLYEFELPIPPSRPTTSSQAHIQSLTGTTPVESPCLHKSTSQVSPHSWSCLSPSFHVPAKSVSTGGCLAPTHRALTEPTLLADYFTAGHSAPLHTVTTPLEAVAIAAGPDSLPALDSATMAGGWSNTSLGARSIPRTLADTSSSGAGSSNSGELLSLLPPDQFALDAPVSQASIRSVPVPIGTSNNTAANAAGVTALSNGRVLVPSRWASYKLGHLSSTPRPGAVGMEPSWPDMTTAAAETFPAQQQFQPPSPPSPPTLQPYKDSPLLTRSQTSIALPPASARTPDALLSPRRPPHASPPVQSHPSALPPLPSVSQALPTHPSPPRTPLPAGPRAMHHHSASALAGDTAHTMPASPPHRPPSHLSCTVPPRLWPTTAVGSPPGAVTSPSQWGSQWSGGGGGLSPMYARGGSSGGGSRATPSGAPSGASLGGLFKRSIDSLHHLMLVGGSSHHSSRARPLPSTMSLTHSHAAPKQATKSSAELGSGAPGPGDWEAGLGGAALHAPQTLIKVPVGSSVGRVQPLILP